MRGQSFKEVLPLPPRKVSTQLVSEYEEIARPKLLPSEDFSRAGCGELVADAHIPIPLPIRWFRLCETQQFSWERLRVFPAQASMARTHFHLTPTMQGERR